MTDFSNDENTIESTSMLHKIKAILKNEIVSFIIGLFLIMFALYLLIPYLSFFITGGADQSILDSASSDLNSTDNGIKNMGGARGAQLAYWLINNSFGVASIFIIAFLGAAGIRMMKVRKLNMWRWFFGCTMLLLWFSLFFGYFFYEAYQDSFIYLGGLHGYNVSLWIESQIGTGGILLLFIISALYILIFFNKKYINKIRDFFSGKYIPNIKRKKKDKSDNSVDEADDSDEFEDENQTKEENNTDKEATLNENDSLEMELNTSADEESLELSKSDKDKIELVIEEKVEEIIEQSLPKGTTQGPKESSKSQDKDAEPAFEVEAAKDDLYRGSLDQPYNPKLDLEGFKFPTLDLMKHFENNDPNVNMEEQNMNKNKIISTLRSFDIEITSIKATVGPTVTLYEITPAQGVRISKIRNLEDDIALSLAALGIRIIAPIPGKGTIGIEVPNENPKVVSGQSIIGSKKFQTCNYELPVAFGKTITNEVFVVDLCKMPHILVAGATGQGKSVGLNTMITSLLYKKHPAELKFVLIDPKKVEFSIYSAIKHHYLAQLPDAEEPIITDVTKVVQTLNSVCVEMDARYDLLKAAKVRNIKEYNEKFINRQLNPEKGHKYMPYIVVVIDEFGDLIMTAGKEIELPIARIAQLARAVGIHMVIATQRPTTNIITGTIKANFPARVAFRVSSMTDSRTILDRPGANQLIGKGDMLYLQGSDPIRVQCAFIDTPEVENITKYIAQQQGYTTPFYLPEYTSEESRAAMGEVDPARLDPLFEDAARMIVIHQQGSTSLIQRKFSIGYNRAGRIMDQLEKMGIVGPSEGSKARQVFCQDEMELDQRLNN
ncbi:cell division protein FtsK/SpoIIIE [Bacteroides coprosuis DSM 18011]|uniref:Cell division protein FtsK/SpoIIIE n=1 Tax=Bacteroides coprosuis DSM 18011 TaxID=679937 RepID=F3ZNQ9_9BACE|nr:cell division protein FtsK/SpoIIIE [Bacteroides coprosuis DSM 18011]